MNIHINKTIRDIATSIKAKITGPPLPDFTIEYVLLDSRKIVIANTTLFFCIALKQEKRNEILKELIEKGVRYFVLDFEPDEFDGNASFLMVNNSLEALQLLASNHREEYKGKVIGITGSNGKTIVKEWLHQLLNDDFNIVRSPRSYNSQIGVPLSVLQLDNNNNLGIFEAGISLPGEMEKLEKIIKPGIGIFTNIGDAHNEGFENIHEKITEKLKLFTNAQHLIYCSDYSIITESINAYLSPDVKLFTWSKNQNADLYIKEIIKSNNQTEIFGLYQDTNVKINIPFSDEASIENAINCWCLLLLLKIDSNLIEYRFKKLHAVEMRLELKQGVNNCSVINDSYSSDIHSLEVALNFLQQQKQHETHTVILSDIQQSGKQPEALYKEVVELLLIKNIQRFIGIGDDLFSLQNLFKAVRNTKFYRTVAEFRKDFYSLYFHNEAILLKGARSFEFEQISAMLEQKVHQTILSINLSAVSHNVREYKKLLHPETKIMAMVKAFSYGSGAFEIARVLQFNKVDYLAVAYADEGVTLRKAGITIPIMVMNPEETSYHSIIQYFLEPEIFSSHILDSFEKYLDSQGLEQYPIHLKVDTGMHRLGFLSNEINGLAGNLKDNKLLRVQSVLSHLIASNDPDKKQITLHQFELFKNMCRQIQDGIGYTFIRHIANTSAISNYPEMQLEMVRAGIGFYGIDSNPLMQKKLMNVTSLFTTIAQIKTVDANETVGYGGNLKLSRASKIATIRIGYADGYHRIFSNGIGKVSIHKQLAPVVGNVCMDMAMVDITDVPNVIEGDTVEVFGNQLPVKYLAEWSGTIPYEILTNISQRVKRIYFEE